MPDHTLPDRQLSVPVRRPAARLVGALAVAGLLVTSACSKDNAAQDDAATQAAEQLAAAVGKGDLGGLPLTGAAAPQAAEQLSGAFQGMGQLRPSVQVTDVRTEGDQATASLRHIWDLDSSDQDWSYETQAVLRREDGTWKTEWNPALVAPELRPDERLRLRSTPADRAEITGTQGKKIVTNRPVWQIGLDKSKASDAATQESSARQLAQTLELDEDTFVTMVKNAGPQAFVTFVTLRTEALTDEQASTIDSTPGAVKVPANLPLAPSRGFATAFLGRVGEATAEEIEASKGKLRTGDMVGRGGLQGRFDQQLRGTAGIEILALGKDSTGGGRTLYEREAQPGTPVRTTLDPEIQQAADDALKDVKPASAAVVIRPSTGEVLAVASGPGSKDYDTARLGRYAPGSTFKVITALSLLRTGMDPSSEVDCSSRATVQGRSFSNYADFPEDMTGKISLEDALAQSCNTAFINEREKIGQTKVREAAHALGLGQPADPARGWFIGDLPEQSSGTEHAAGLIGQGKDSASPLGMAVVMASVIKGAPVTPVLLPEVEPAAPLNPAHPVTPQEAEKLRQMMRKVVTDGGGGAVKDLSGDPIAKTGTAEYGNENPPKRHAWFMAGRGDLAAVVFVEDGEFGSTTAGPVMAELLRAIP